MNITKTTYILHIPIGYKVFNLNTVVH